jgi:hypothetical protein
MLNRKVPNTLYTLLFVWSFFLTGSPLLASEWVPLINGHLSDNWTTQGAWTLHNNGVVHLPERDYKHWKNYENYLVLKDISVTNFEIDFDWRTDQNSGLYFHIPDLSQLQARHHKEVQLYENSLWSKPEFGDHTAGGIIPGHAPTKNASKPAKQWNHMHIRCVDNQITVSINNEVVNQANLNEGVAGKRSSHGGFAFQDHGYAVWIKDIRLKILDKDE